MDPLTLWTQITGSQGHLDVVVRKYTPSVVCGDRFDEPQVPSPCRNTLNEVPAGGDLFEFGRQGVPGVQVKLPWTYRASTFTP